jgi:hypothetical protein
MIGKTIDVIIIPIDDLYTYITVNYYLNIQNFATFFAFF